MQTATMEVVPEFLLEVVEAVTVLQTAENPGCPAGFTYTAESTGGCGARSVQTLAADGNGGIR